MKVTILKLCVPSQIIGAPPETIGELFYEDNKIKFEGEVDPTAASVLNTINHQCRLQIMQIVDHIIKSETQKAKTIYLQIDGQ